MPRYKLTIEYDGTGFAGWQRQKNGSSVQQTIEEAIVKFTGETVNLFCAGRTDAGVHAKGQCAHLDLSRDFPARTVQNAINYHVKPSLIAIVDSTIVPDDFHARFNAMRRYYRYRILNRYAPSVLDLTRVWHISRTLDVEAMQQGASYLIGQHDFTSFRAIQCQAKSPVKTLDEIIISKHGDEIWLELAAPSFLHHMVRNITGTLVTVGQGKWQPEEVKKALEAKDRTMAGMTAPSQGLYFMRVDYPDSR